MKTVRTLTLALLIAALAVTPAVAKRHGFNNQGDHNDKRMERIEHLKQRLDLSPEQQDAIQEIFTENREELRVLREEARANREDLRMVVDAEILDEPRMREMVFEQAEIRADMMVARHAARSKINRLLTPEQRQTRDEMQERRSERMARKHAGSFTE